MSAATEPRTRWAVVFTAIGAGVLLGFQVGKAPPLIGAIRAELGFSLVEAGLYMSLINGFAVLSGIVAGVMADNAGRRRVLILATVCLIAGNALGAVAVSMPMMFASRFLEAFGFVGAVVSAPGLIVEASRTRDLNTSLTLWSTYMPAGFGVMMALTVWTTTPSDWRAIWWLNAVIAAAWLALFLWIGRGVGAPPPETRRLEGLHSVLSRPGPWLLGLCFGMYTIQWFGVLNWLPTMLLAAGVDADDAGLGVALVVGINAIGCMGAGPVLKTGMPRWLVIAACSLVLGVLTLWIYDPGLPPALRLALAGVFSVTGGLIPGAALSGAAIHSPSPKQVSLTNGVIVQCTNLGSLVGPPAVAAVAASAGGDFTAARWLTLAAGVAGAAFALILRGVERRMAGSA